jgi:hypothetical protein
MSISKIVWLSAISLCLFGSWLLVKNRFQAMPKESANICYGKYPNFSIELIKTNNRGDLDDKGGNHAIIFNPKSTKLDFKVNVGLAHKIYAKNSKNKLIKNYIPKTFSEIVKDENAKLNGTMPFAAINADYIDRDDRPQGLNISRGVEYSGIFKNKRSSFGISAGRPSERRATIQAGKRTDNTLNYNIVGGNGRFYRQGKFKNICQDLGEYACQNSTNRSMVAISDRGFVILLVNNSNTIDSTLYPDTFDDVLEGIARNFCLGKIQDGMLFDGGLSPGLYYNNQIYVENPGPIGSVFLIYKKQ